MQVAVITEAVAFVGLVLKVVRVVADEVMIGVCDCRCVFENLPFTDGSFTEQLGLLQKPNKPPLKNFNFLGIPQYLFDVPKSGDVPNQGFSVGESTPHPALLSAERSCGAGETLLPSGPLGVVKAGCKTFVEATGGAWRRLQI